MAINSAAQAAIRKHCLPQLVDLGKEMHRHLVIETHHDTGDLRQDAYAAIDDVTGNLEVGYDESNRERPHGYFYTFGTSVQEGDPALMRVAFRRRKPRKI